MQTYTDINIVYVAYLLGRGHAGWSDDRQIPGDKVQDLLLAVREHFLLLERPERLLERLRRNARRRSVRVVLAGDPGRSQLPQIRSDALAAFGRQRGLRLLASFSHPMLHVGGQTGVQPRPEGQDGDDHVHLGSGDQFVEFLQRLHLGRGIFLGHFAQNHLKAGVDICVQLVEQSFASGRGLHLGGAAGRLESGQDGNVNAAVGQRSESDERQRSAKQFSTSTTVRWLPKRKPNCIIIPLLDSSPDASYPRIIFGSILRLLFGFPTHDDDDARPEC